MLRVINSSIKFVSLQRREEFRLKKSSFILRKSFAVVAIFLVSLLSGYAQDGAKLFKSNCASCHKINDVLVGPALRGISERAPSQDWIIKWVQNPQQLIDAGDEYALQVEQYHPSAMPAHPHLKDADVVAIIDYVENYEAPKPQSSSASGSSTAQKTSGGDYTYILLGAILLLIALILILSKVMGTLTTVIVEKEPDAEEYLPKVKSLKDRWRSFRKHNVTVAIVVLILINVAGKLLWDGATSLGRQQDYQPTQPIKFSHKLHAGLNKIDCKYCHVGVEKGKSAVIPSLNICMNCHKAIKEGPEHGTTEIAKIYEGIGWNPETQQYDREPKGVKWVRIHNLPDHVYFNHSQHVKVGGIECQKCHGPIEEMEEVYQFSPLSMGWCINCHRETEVKFTNNEYYTSFKKLHEQLKNKEIDKVTVEKIGGTECQKCHY